MIMEVHNCNITGLSILPTQYWNARMACGVIKELSIAMLWKQLVSGFMYEQ